MSHAMQVNMCVAIPTTVNMVKFGRKYPSLAFQTLVSIESYIVSSHIGVSLYLHLHLLLCKCNPNAESKKSSYRKEETTTNFRSSLALQ